MKKILITIKIALVVNIILVLQSCSKKIEEAYINPNAQVRQPIEVILPNIISNMCISNTAQGSNYGTQLDGQYVGRYVQFWATNTAADQYDRMGMTTTNSTAAAADIGGSQWAMHYYGQGQNLNKVIEWGIEEKKWDYVGVAYAIRAFGWLAVTDMHGEVILKDAFNTKLLTFRYDSQEEVYEEVKRNCLLAIDYLSRTGDGVSATNLALGANYTSMKGDREKWKKFTYAIMARVYHRITNKSNYNPDLVIQYANLAMSDNADNSYILFENVSNGTRSFYGSTRGNIGVLRQTKFSADLLSGVNTTFPGVQDPRAWYILRENTNVIPTFKGIRPGAGLPDGLSATDQPLNYWGSSGTTGNDANARYIYRDGMPWPLATAAEMEFLKAEAYYRKLQKPAALTAYTNGISKNIDMLTSVYTNAIPVAAEITPAVKTAFLANPLVVPTSANLNLSHIMLQKFIAMYGFGFMETWADMRRYHYLDFETGTTRQVYTDFVPPATLFANNNGKLIYRVRPRYNSEYRWNVEALIPLGGLALDYHTKRQWFTEP